jgi:hypothetical protein
MRHDWYPGSPHATTARAPHAASAAAHARAATAPGAPAQARSAGPGTAGTRTHAEPDPPGARAGAAPAAGGGLGSGTRGPEAAGFFGVTARRGRQAQACAAYGGPSRAGHDRFEVQACHLGQVVREL